MPTRTGLPQDKFEDCDDPPVPPLGAEAGAGAEADSAAEASEQQLGGE